jgi:predicted AAA+ superfamily ATPase
MFKTFEIVSFIIKMAISENKLLSNKPMLLFLEKLKSLEKRVSRLTFEGKKVIIFEGLHGCGKSTLIKAMSPISDAANIISFPSFLIDVCDQFTSHSELFSRIFDFVSLYFIADEVQEAKEEIVFVERFYHAVCSHTICSGPIKENEISGLPDITFDWPIDLPKPNMV